VETALSLDLIKFSNAARC